MELHLIAERPITVANEDRERVAAHIGSHKIGHAILIDIEWGDGGGIFTDFVAGKVVEEIRRHVGVLLGAGGRQQKNDDGAAEQPASPSDRHSLPSPHKPVSRPSGIIMPPRLERGVSIPVATFTWQ